MRFKKHIFIFCLLALIILPGLVLADTASTGLGQVQAGLNQTAGDTGLKTSNDLPTIIGRFVNYMFAVVGVVFMTITLVGGYLWMTAGGNEEKIGKAKGFIVNGINGMIVIFLSYALVYTMLAALKAATGN